MCELVNNVCACVSVSNSTVVNPHMHAQGGVAVVIEFVSDCLFWPNLGNGKLNGNKEKS